MQQISALRIDDNHPQASDTTRTGRYWTLTVVGDGYNAGLILSHNDMTNPGVCQHLPNGDWDYVQNSVSPATVGRALVADLNGEWVVGVAQSNGQQQVFLPLVTR